MSVATGSRPQAGPPLSGAEILQNARALATRIREKNLAAEYDRLRRLPDDAVGREMYPHLGLGLSRRARPSGCDVPRSPVEEAGAGRAPDRRGAGRLLAFAYACVPDGARRGVADLRHDRGQRDLLREEPVRPPSARPPPPVSTSSARPKAGKASGRCCSAVNRPFRSSEDTKA